MTLLGTVKTYIWTVLKFGLKPRINLNGWSLLFGVLLFILGWQIGHRDYLLSWKNYKPEIKVTNQDSPDSKVNIDFKLFWQTWNLLENKYIDKKALDPQKLYYGAIQGMVAALGDPYTVFLPPQAQKATKEQLNGEFDGVGMQLGYNKEKRLAVIAPLKDTPAEKARVKPGDLILKIEGRDATSLTLPEAVALIRGPKGTTVNLSLFTEGDSKPHDIALTREMIIVKSVEYDTKTTIASDTKLTKNPDGTDAKAGASDAEKDSKVETKTTKSGKTVAYLRLSSFGEHTQDEWNQAVSATLAKGVQGVVLDVRNNPGGYLDSGVYIASEFLDGGAVVLQEDATGNRTTQTVTREGKLLKLPVVVLINKGSASASEILAGAIQDRKRGILIGEQSFGKGTIQSAEDLPDGTGIHVTTAKWLTPNGRWIHGVGLTPDISVSFDQNAKALDSDGKTVDPQLDRALQELDKD